MVKELTHQPKTDSDLESAGNMIFSIMPWRKRIWDLRKGKELHPLINWFRFHSKQSKTKYRKLEDSRIQLAL